jgi:hypothetical protein
MSQLVMPRNGQSPLTQLLKLKMFGGTAYLFSVNVVPSFDTGIGDLPVETIGGTGAIGTNFFSVPFLDPSQEWTVASTRVLLWTATGPDLGKTIYGWAQLDIGGKLLFAERFDTPMVIVSIGQGVLLEPILRPEALAGTGFVSD